MIEAALALVLLVAGQPEHDAQPEPTGKLVERILNALPVAEAENRVEVGATVSSVSARADWRIDKKGAWKESKTITATLAIDLRKAQVANVDAVISEVIGESGVNLIVERPKEKARQDERAVLEQRFWMMLRAAGPVRVPPIQIVGAVSGLAKRYQRIAGHVECVVADLVAENVEPKVMDEAVEIVPGVTFLWSKVPEDGKDPKDGAFVYEARVKRLKGEKAGMEPVFAGVQLEDEDGRVLVQWQNQQRVETAGEYLYIGRAYQLSKSVRERAKEWNVCVFDGLRRQRFEFEARDLEVSPQVSGDGKPVIEDDATGK